MPKPALESKYTRMLQHIHEGQRRGQLFTVAQLADKLHLRQAQVLELAEDNGLNVNVGFGIAGAGTARYERIGEYDIEDNNYDPTTPT